MPVVSVLMSVHNGQRYLREAVDGILAQSFENFEFLIIDDASTDGTARILDGYDDPRMVRLFNKKNLGLTRSLNRGLKEARGVFIARQDDDDISLPERLASQVSVMEGDLNVVLCAGNTEIIDSDGRTIARSRRDCDPDLVGWYLMFHNHIAGHGQVMFRADVAHRLGGYDEKMTASQDHEFWLRLADAGKIMIVNKTFLKTRLHEGRLSNTKAEEQERLSLQTSQKAIRRRTGLSLGLRTVRRLRRFWSGDFRNLESPENIHRLLVQILDGQGARKRRQSVARQFLKWAGKLSLRQEFGDHLRMTRYAFKWAPGAAVRYWLWDMWAKRLGLGDVREGGTG